MDNKITLPVENEENNWKYLSEALSGKSEAVLYIKEHFIIPACNYTFQRLPALGKIGVTSNKLADDFWAYYPNARYWMTSRSSDTRCRFRTHINVSLSSFLLHNNKYKEIMKKIVDQNIRKLGGFSLEVILYEILNTNLKDDILMIEEQKTIRLYYLGAMSLQEISEILEKDTNVIEELRISAMRKIEDYLSGSGRHERSLES